MPNSTRRPRRSPDAHLAPRQIVGISLAPEMASEVKAYAGKHGLSLRKLFEDMWRIYKKQNPD
jgi:hypothetical protein